MKNIVLSKTEIKLIESMYNNNYTTLEHYDFNVRRAAESLADRYPFYFSNRYSHYNDVKGRKVYVFECRQLGFMADFLKGVHHPDYLAAIGEAMKVINKGFKVMT